MCGISGFNWKNEELVKSMSGTITHRGPDVSGFFCDEGISFGHNRLSIIDLSSLANQPMSDDTGNLVLVFNGEIYNYQDLKKELFNEYNFKTQSDTEVILAGYKKWGSKVVTKLNGIFSFAIWDKKQKKLFCARDHMGVKPFYYYWDGEKFIFASEIKSILDHNVPRVLDMDAFNEYLRVLYVPEPRTMILGINKLSPGHTITLVGGRLSVDLYYKPQLEVKDSGYTDAKEKLKRVVEEAVERQLVADVPVGVYLSGGIDSSVVLSSVSKVRKNVKTFSIGFDLEEDEEKEKFNFDFKLAEQTAKYFGSEHYPMTIGAKDVADSLEDIIGSIDDPVSNPTAIPMAHLSRFAKKEVTVSLSGNGGDELLGGYERYRMSRRADLIDKIPGAKYFLPNKIKKAVEMSALDRLVQFEFEKDHRLSKVVNDKYLKPISEIRKTFQKYIPDSLDKTTDLMFADLVSWLPDQALSLGDKMSMFGSLEERVPFLDREVVDLAMSFPINFKVGPFKTKKILKDAFRDELPNFLFVQPKRGWFSPGAKWIRRKEIEAIFRRVLSDGYYANTAPLFNWSAVDDMLNKHISKEDYNLTILWAIMTFQVWARKYNISL